MKEIKDLKINGKTVWLCKIGGGGIMYRKERYEELEYIQGTGSQYIITDIAGNTVTAFHLQWEGCHAYSAILSNGLSDFTVGCNEPSGAKWTLTMYGVTRTTSIQSCEVSYNDGVVAYDGTTIRDIPTAAKGAAPLYMFYTAYSVDSNRRFRGKIFYLDITAGGTEHSFRPCRRLTDGAIGMYDILTKQFLTNRGGGEFVGGAPTGVFY